MGGNVSAFDVVTVTVDSIIIGVSLHARTRKHGEDGP